MRHQRSNLMIQITIKTTMRLKLVLQYLRAMHNNLFKKTGVCMIENKLNYEDTLLYCEIQFHHNLSSS